MSCRRRDNRLGGTHVEHRIADFVEWSAGYFGRTLESDVPQNRRLHHPRIKGAVRAVVTSTSSEFRSEGRKRFGCRETPGFKPVHDLAIHPGEANRRNSFGTAHNAHSNGD